MNVVIVTKALAPYRARFYDEVAKQVHQDGGVLTVIVARKAASDHPWKNVEGEAGTAQFVYLREGWIGKALSFIVPKLIRTAKDISFPSLNQLLTLRRCKPDRVWVHEYSPYCMAAVIWAKVAKLPVIVSTDVGSNPSDHACSSILLGFQRKVLGMYSGIIACTMEATRRNNPKNIPVIFAPHAICVDEYSIGNQGSLCTYLFVGRLSERKGISTLISIFDEVMSSTGHKFKLIVAGIGELEKEVAELAKQRDWLDYRGFVEGEELRSLYELSDVFVFPTLEDTYAVVLHEAGAAGLALICSEHAGAAENLIMNGENGFVLPTDATEPWIESIKIYLENDQELIRHQQKSIEIAKQFCVNKLGKEVFKWLKKISCS